MGYYDICYVGGEVRNPARVIPRSILFSVLVVAVIYAVDESEHHRGGAVARGDAVEVHRGGIHREALWPEAAAAVTLLVLWTAFASVFALLLGYSRIIWAAANAGTSFRCLQSFTRAASFRMSPCWCSAESRFWEAFLRWTKSSRPC